MRKQKKTKKMKPELDPEKHEWDIKHLQNYLKEFGYLELDNPAKDHFGPIRKIGLEKAENGKFDNATEAAVKKFQNFYRIKITGKFDRDTVHLMGMPRCGFPDTPPDTPTDEPRGDVANFVVDGRRWNGTHLTYSFNNFTTDLTQQVIIDVLREAFARWSNVCNLTFTEVSGVGDIVISFQTGDHGDGDPFDGPRNVLAHAFFPPPSAFAGDLHFDDDENWTTTDATSGFDLLTVAIHELGHSLGLRHSAVNDSIMFPIYNGIRRNLHPDDIDGISSIYGARNLKATLRDRSIASPAFTTFNGRGYIVWSGTNAQRNLNVMTTDNLRVFHGKIILAETSLSGPSLAVFNGRLYIAWRGVNNNLLNVMSSSDGINWAGKVTLPETTFFRPSLGVYQDKLVLAWTGTDSARKLNIIQSTNGTAWSNKLTLGDTSIEGPDLCTLGQNLLITWAGTDYQHHINVMTFNGSAWSNKVTLGETSSVSPSIENISGRIYLSWTGRDVDNRLNTLVSTDGITFFSKVTYSDSSYLGPAVASFNNTPVLAWTGRDAARSLNVSGI